MMGKPDKPKPIPIKVGSVVVMIYRPTAKRLYHRIVYRESKGGKRINVYAKSEAEARAKAQKICVDLARGRLSADNLTTEQKLQAIAGLDLLVPHGLTLDGACREAAGAREIAPGVGVLEMARFWARHHLNGAGAAVPLPEIHAKLLNEIRDHDLAPRWRQALKLDLKKFVDAFAARPIAEITADEIQDWLREQRGNWRTHNNRLALIKQFFAFARRKKFLPQDRDTEAAAIKRLPKPRGEHSRPGVLSAGELRDLLHHVSERWLPYVALGAFAGLRRAEIHRLDWSDVLWEEKSIHVREEVAKKTGRKAGDERYVPMREQLLAWLEPWQRHQSGPVCTRTRFEDELNRLRQPAKDEKGNVLRPAVVTGKWPKNALRHTFGSCRTAETKNMATVAHEMGNSVAEVRRDYNNPRSNREVQAWAALQPPGMFLPGIVVPMNGHRA